jgi:hypothetical protein
MFRRNAAEAPTNTLFTESFVVWFAKSAGWCARIINNFVSL